MSNVAEAMDFRVGIAEWLGTLANFYKIDIRAIPENLLTVSPGGVARPANAISGEVVGLMHWTATTLRGEVPIVRSEEEMEAAGASLTTHDAICEAFDKATADLSDAIRTTNPSEYQRIVTAPFGLDLPLMAMVQITVNHIWYHDGQLNYIQALNGDSKVHWMG